MSYPDRGKSPRSALSERLLASNSPGEVAIDIPRPSRPSLASAPDTLQERSPSSDSRSLRRRNSGHGSGASNSVDTGRRHAASDDFGGKSPLLGSPWPYLMHKRHKDPPAEHAGPTSVPEGREQEDNTEAAQRMHIGSISGCSTHLFTSHTELYTYNAPQREESNAAEEGNAQNPLASTDSLEPAAMGRHRSGRIEERLSFVSGRGGWHPTSAPDTNGEPLHTDGLGSLEEGEPLMPQQPKQPKSKRYTNEILYGIINAIVGAPTMISFAAIVYQDELYTPYLGQLAKLAFLASAVHQAIFTIFSTLPFAVGQICLEVKGKALVVVIRQEATVMVQDVGLIFLSAMASSIALLCKEDGYEPREALGTSLLTLAIATFIVGILIVLVGYFKLASLVQYVPLPTVGGYLGYVGYFCLAAGINLACNVEINTFQSWKNIANADALIKLAPAAGATLVLLLTLKFGRNPLALPAVLVCIPVVFHIVLLATGTSLQQAADAHWVMQPEPPRYFWQIYELFNIHDAKLDGVSFSAMAQQFPKVIGLFVVVAFGSSLDVAAIQADSPEPLDYNHELKTVGLSNTITALTGAGLTGSYIFSQTIFSMRAGVHTRLHGAIIAGVEFGLFLLPISIIHYLPNFFFGSLLMLFGVEILMDWLIYSFKKVSRMEFLLLWATFIAIMLTDLERGIGIGIIMAVLYFAYSYAQVTVKAFTVVPTRSGVLRAVSEREVLDLFNARLAAISLSGFIFFGSSVKISDQVMAVARTLVAHEDAVLEAEASNPMQQKARELGVDPLWAPDRKAQTAAAFASAPRFLLLDFRAVHGLDATAAQTFGTLFNMLDGLGVEMVITHMENPEMEKLLRAHGVIGSNCCMAFSTMEEGMRYCEGEFLEVAQRHGLCRPSNSVLTLKDILELHASVIPGKYDMADMAKRLSNSMKEKHYEPGECLTEMSEESDSFYIIEEGTVSVEAAFVDIPLAQRAVSFPVNVAAPNNSWQFMFGPGTLTGATDFILRQPRTFRVTAHEGKVRAVSMHRSEFEALADTDPEAMIVLLTMLTRTSVVDATHVWEQLARQNASAP